MYIYLIECIVNDKIYIGQTTKEDPYDRWIDHKSAAKTGVDSMAITRAIRKYSAENFIFTPIEYYSTLPELNSAEAYWISYLRDALGRNNLYNIKDGGAKGKHSEETKRKMSEALKGNTRWKGKHHSDEFKQQQSERMKDNTYNLGKQISQEAKQKLSKAHTGKKHSEASKQKISVSKKAKKLTVKNSPTDATIAPAEARRGTHMPEANKLNLSRINRGSGNSHAVLDEEKVMEIKIILMNRTGSGSRQSPTIKEIANKFGVSHGIIKAIACDRTWKHVIVKKT